VCTFREIERQLAGFADERPGALDGTGVGEPTLAGLRLTGTDGGR
jgi:NADH-quinone oxidoreductase subunit E